MKVTDFIRMSREARLGFLAGEVTAIQRENSARSKRLDDLRSELRALESEGDRFTKSARECAWDTFKLIDRLMLDEGE